MSLFFFWRVCILMVMDQRVKLKKLVDLLPDRYVVLVWTKESFKEFVDTDAYGIASATFRLAREVLLGAYTVLVTVGDTTAEKTITVDRYALPKYNIAVDTDKAFYAPGETLSGTVDVQYFFGQPVSGGEVTITAQQYDVSFNTFTTVAGHSVYMA